MNHPYRGAWLIGPHASEVEPVRSVRLRSLIVAAALVFVGINAGMAYVAYSYAALSAKTLASARVYERAGDRHFDAHRARGVRARANTHRASRAVFGGGRGAAFRGDDIVRIGATAFLLDASFVDRVLEEQTELMSSARVVPVAEDGKVTGIRLFGVEPGGRLARLGFETGDDVQRINGRDIASPEKALEAYASLRSSDRLTVQIKRKGTIMILRYYLF